MMKRFWMSAAFWVAMAGVTIGTAYGQDRESGREDSDRSEHRESRSSDSERSDSSRSEETSESRRDRSRSAREDERRPERSREQRSRDGRMGDDEVRLRYSDDRNRLSIDVDEDIQFRDEQERRGWARGGEFDLRYDIDEHRLRAAGEGTIEVDRAANAMARWWQSWWEEEKTARRSRQQSSESGARLFIRQHDENGDDYLSRRELPEKLRSEFARVDRNDDGYLSRNEVRQYGEGMSATARRGSSGDRETAASSPRERDSQTWAQWWSSWWSDESRTGEAPERIATRGAREFIRLHDQNDDGFLVRSELPDRMYDDFDRLDANGDRYVIRSEIEQYAQRMSRDRSESSASRMEDRRR